MCADVFCYCTLAQVPDVILSRKKWGKIGVADSVKSYSMISGAYLPEGFDLGTL